MLIDDQPSLDASVADWRRWIEKMESRKRGGQTDEVIEAEINIAKAVIAEMEADRIAAG